jgi:hypothetical protein
MKHPTMNVKIIQTTTNLTFHNFHISIFKQQPCLENNFGITTTLITLSSNAWLQNEGSLCSNFKRVL